MPLRVRNRRRKLQEQKMQKRVLFDELAKWEREHKGKSSTAYTEDLASQALQSQRTHEADVSFHSECDLHKSLIMCKKNAGHTNFISAPQFHLQSLPRKYQDHDIYDCVKVLISLTVILKVRYTSENRPDGYDFWEQRGKHALERWGSGSVFIPRKTPKGKMCPCQQCKSSPNPSKNWYFVWVSTAHHVVFDDLEAAQTEVGMHFDDDNNRTSYRRLQGIRLVNYDAQSDRCILECVTHSNGTRKAIERARAHIRQKEIKLNEKYAKEIATNGQPLLAVIVSHPHGCSKQVSIGTHVVKKHIRDNCSEVEWTEYFYDAPTCRGCSGALVWLLGHVRVGYRDGLITTHTHTGHHKGIINKSGGGLDFVTQKRLSGPLVVTHFARSVFVNRSHHNVLRRIISFLCHFISSFIILAIVLY